MEDCHSNGDRAAKMAVLMVFCPLGGSGGVCERHKVPGSLGGP